MLANYRCNEIKNSVVEAHVEVINEFTNTSYVKLMKNFKSECKEITEKIMGKKIH